ncbi:MAG: hypothetical protein AVDCRST_MAG73-282 [uncultured Thermomicrobiales bacterium]|uniref:Uncharacterized protein n=1 Tax=uncultured Thermomicrobiales bacterium TaxID=1645740 RepID=A0A6J4THV6_9BACT|nr:MAG: hypothetical protein AVDCRST_MAG73-282 [uncultured Thermomicrobiales bacterium]
MAKVSNDAGGITVGREPAASPGARGGGPRRPYPAGARRPSPSWAVSLGTEEDQVSLRQ